MAQSWAAWNRTDSGLLLHAVGFFAIFVFLPLKKKEKKKEMLTEPPLLGVASGSAPMVTSESTGSGSQIQALQCHARRNLIAPFLVMLKIHFDFVI